MSNIHKWEYDGHGKAPFTCVGTYAFPEKSLAEKNPAAYNSQLKMMPKGYGVGSCGVCGRPLVNNFLIKSADGKKFSVGCECVEKSGDRGLTTITNQKRLEIEREKRRIKKEQVRTLELQRQRDKNGGLTDYEVKIKEQERKQKERAKLIKKSGLLEIAENLEDGKYGFRDSVADDLRRGNIPCGRGLGITIDILSKLVDKKDRNKEKDRLMKVLKKAEKLLAN